MRERLGGWARLPAARNAVLAALLLVTTLVVNGPNAVWSGDLGPTRIVDDSDQAAVWWTASVAVVVAVALRGRWPVPMAALAAAAVTTHVLLPAPIALVDLGVLLLLYTVALRHRRAVSLAVLGCLVLLATGWALANALANRQSAEQPPPPRPPRVVPAPPLPRPEPVFLPSEDAWDTSRSELTVFASALLAAWAVGSSTRSRRAHLDELRARARELERDRDLQAAFAVAAERGRISRELHDVVAHGLSVMVIQAQGGAAALDNRPADTRSALDAIVRTGRESLADMRRVLAAVGAVDDTWHPQPGLAQLTALAAQVRKAGTPVDLRVDGTTVPLPSTVDLSAYRIVQEALTNTMKHAGKGAKAEVVLSYGKAEVGIRVSDDGRGAADRTGGGNGLRGMRERVRLLGGSLVAGPGPAGGFVVRAALPIQGGDA
ncbi:sensor histidine kinase [Umezawaea endophytica]|uniref:histidine kinase n=1 Tax=Umezawaea endophytica TaxID=1654476 RepID=A0A9X2VG18_9PSEU|nr:sensor histidine kinase [Umezawaea endophytica]MCS7475782.1 sensor histidine kinase [Umezawaea endophytica]